jgi:2-hydroxychromene-2-carboxylate isomerase
MQATWYFDFISPFSYLQLRKILALRERVPIVPKPIVFAAVLNHVGQLGPAEIPAKRLFTYRFVHWQAQAAGITLQFPPQHPFNPVSALRLCVAAGATWPSIVAIFDHLWRDGHAGSNAAQLSDVGRRLGISDLENAINAQDVKNTLRANTDEAIAAEVFGVPTLLIDGQKFFGNDATPMIEAYLSDPQLFERSPMRELAALPIGIARARKL